MFRGILEGVLRVSRVFWGACEGVLWVSGVCLRWFGFFKGFWGASQCKWGFQGGLRDSNSVTSFQD